LLAQLGLETSSTAVTYVIAFAIIFVLLTLFALVLRRLTGGRSMLAGQGGRTRQPRLGIVDVYDLDRQRQLILLRRDNVEHLLLIGGPNDVVIETNIERVPGVRAQPRSEHPERIEANDRPPEAVPARPVVEALPLRATAEGGERGRGGNVTALSTEAAVSASMQPSPTRAEAVLKPDVVALQGGRAALRRPEAAPPPAAPAPRPEAPRRSAPIPPALAEASPKPAPAPAPAPIWEPKGPDAAILSDMAKQLEEALKRPMAPAKAPEPAPPPPVRAEPPMPARPPAPPPVRPPAPPPPRTAQAEPVQKAPGPPPPAPSPATPRPTPPAAAPSAPPAPNGPEPAEVRAAAKPAPRPEPPAAKPQAGPEAKSQAKPEAGPQAGPEPKPQAKPQAGPEARPETPAEAPPRVSDPFSVEEIEAEFARLLGRPFDKNDKGDKA